MNHPSPQQPPLHQRKRNFLQGLGNIMIQRGIPLPPQLTGVPYPASFDPSGSPWRTLDVSPADIGVVRLASRDVDLFKLWALVQQGGGSTKVHEQGMWGQVLPHFDLPEQFLQSNGAAQSTAAALRHYYNSIIGPFEEAYRKNMREQQQRALQQGRPQGGVPMSAGVPSRSGPNPMTGTFPPVGTLPAMNGNSSSGMLGQATAGNALQPTDTSLGGMNGVPFAASQGLAQTPHGSQLPTNGMSVAPDVRSLGPMDIPSQDGSSIAVTASGSNSSVPELEGDGRKRKVDELEDASGKRVRQRIGENSDPRNPGQPGPSGQSAAMNAAPRSRKPSRRKITYVPYAREVETAGGRDLDALQQEFAHAAQKPLRDLNDWGTIDVEALTMSIRSRIGTELSYALTTYTILTLVRIKDGSFLIAQTPDFFEELLDLLEEVAYNGVEDLDGDDHPDTPIITHRQLLNRLIEEGSDQFASLKPKQGVRDPSCGPQQRPGDIILAITNIIRNLSSTSENLDYLARHPRLQDILLRLCGLKKTPPDVTPVPLSPALSLNDLIVVRKDVLYFFVMVGPYSHLSASPSSPSVSEMRRARRAYELLVSYLIDPSEAVTPYAYLLLNGVQSNLQSNRPPSIVDSALEAFTRLSHTDDNRLVLHKAIPQEWLWSTVDAFVHRLPLDHSDFQILMRPEWLVYMERVIMSLYSIAFFAPPAIKKRMKTDRQLSFTKVYLRLIKRLSIYSPPDSRPTFAVSLRRAIETMKLVDEAGDSFDSSPSTMPTLSFGMGYGEHGEARVEKGMGILSGYQEEITWGLMVQRELDEPTFAELVSLVRVDPGP
ncbi:hypothetical protein BDW22DRAFT_1404472 [Trametopsis cervina]|nr:hypothetical protein BDW22DRAFT_1404472 [Trametopsis cervina]